MPDQASLFALVPRHFLRCTLEFPWFAPLENPGNPLFSLGGQAFAGLGKHFLLFLLDVVEVTVLELTESLHPAARIHVGLDQFAQLVVDLLVLAYGVTDRKSVVYGKSVSVRV